MNLRTLCCLCYALAAALADAKSAPQLCGTYPGNGYEALDLHQRFQRRLAAAGKTPRAASQRRDADIGNIAVLESDDSISARRNPFNLDKTQLTFTPASGKYNYALTAGVFSRSPANLERARRDLEAGNVYFNRGITGALVARQPFGGYRMSGIGSKAGGPDYLLQFTVPRTVTENTLRRGFAPTRPSGDGRRHG